MTVMDDSEVSGAHSVQVLIILVVNPDNLSLPFTLVDEFFDVLLTSRANMGADYSHEVIEGTSLRR